MKTFIDEAEIFTDPTHSDTHKVSVVGALTIPDSFYISLKNIFLELKQQWGYTGEVKGNQLIEEQVRLLVEVLEKHHVLFDAVIVDTKFFTPSIITNHKSQFANTILDNISSYHSQNVIKQIKALSNTISKLSDQLYTQNLAMTSLVNRSHQLSTLFYAQRIPKELAKFDWIIDAKQKNITKSEKFWKDMLLPCLEGMNIINPMIMLEDADYSHYHKFNDDQRPEFGSVNKIVKNLVFRDSVTEEGLQLVDILTTSLRKALNHKFKIEGWKRIGKLMVHMKGINLLSIILEGVIPEQQSMPYYHVLKTLNNEARSMIV
ncbi:MAG: DUF3800 domain-containing protein [Candidatus Thorarchaeota archaeon]